jgi:anti-anti-sigma factor
VLPFEAGYAGPRLGRPAARAGGHVALDDCAGAGSVFRAYREGMNRLAQLGQEQEGHVGLVYPTAAVRDERLAAFVGTGLQRGEQVVLMAEPDDHTWLARLALRGVDVGRATREGSLATLDPPRFYPAQGQAALVDRMLGTGRPGLRLAAHAETALGYLGEAGYRRVEQEMDHLCATRPVTLLCQLQAETTSGQQPVPFLPAVIDAHRHALHGRSVTINRDVHGVQLTGELDLDCGGLVEAVLKRAVEVGANEGASAAKGIVVDLSELDFMDVAGFRALLAGTKQWRERGGILVLAGAHGLVRRVIEVIGGKDRGDVVLR